MQVAPASITESLEYLHGKLDAHFSSLQALRAQLDPASPVFALEHGLDDHELALVKSAVREAVLQGFGRAFRRFWLPFVVYAAEVGYDYAGEEYWPTFEAATPGWTTNGNRQQIKALFLDFAARYGGARPTGAWADHFRIICWPITHAVLPTYLQRQLAQLMYEFRTGLTPTLLNDPPALGERLALRSAGYTERFRIFCQNTGLLGQVAAALMSGEEDSPYLLASTLHRVVVALSKESQSRTWLHETKRYAHQVRSRGSGSRADRSVGPRVAPRSQKSDPRLLLRGEPGRWTPVLVLPDLSLSWATETSIHDEVRSGQAVVAGVAKRLAPGRLVYPEQEVVLDTWPPADQPIIQLVRGSDQANEILARQSQITPGPWWLFRVRPGAPAQQVKSGVVRPGNMYCLVGRVDGITPRAPWITPAALNAEGAVAFDLTVPAAVSESDIATLKSVDLSVLAGVQVRPVGLIAAAWDGESAIEWLVGDTPAIGVRCERTPSRMVVTVDGAPNLFTWPDSASESFLQFEELEVGEHTIVIGLQPPGGEAPMASVSLQVRVRDPQSRPEGATRGEGIRVLASPARPSLSELWNDKAGLKIEGPVGERVTLALTLRDYAGHTLATAHHTRELPIGLSKWREFARTELRSHDFEVKYDAADSLELTVSRAGLGYATAHAERGFQPLRWFLTRLGRVPVARLIDRTDGGETRVEFYSVADPTTPVAMPTHSDVEIPPQGGLLRAIAGDVVAATILPPDRNQLMTFGSSHPMVPEARRSTAGMVALILDHAKWSDADLPADPFARHEQELVCDAITTELVCGLAGSARWTRLERILEDGEALDHLEQMQDLVGDARLHRAAASEIARNLWRWAQTSTELGPGFGVAIRDLAKSAGIGNGPHLVRFLLCLVSTPGKLASWEPEDRRRLINGILLTPALVRAARFAVLGTRALQADSVGNEAAGGNR